MTLAWLSEAIGNTLILLFIVGIPLYGWYRKVPVYDTFVEGAKGGFPIFLRIFPYMLAMLMAIGMLRAAGAFDLLNQWLGPSMNRMGIPLEIVPIALLRPFSAGAAMGVVADLLHTHGGNATLSHLGAIVSNSADTTFYIAAIYFGAAGIRNTRYAIPVSILVDIIGMLSAVWIGQWLL